MFYFLALSIHPLSDCGYQQREFWTLFLTGSIPLSVSLESQAVPATMFPPSSSFPTSIPPVCINHILFPDISLDISRRLGRPGHMPGHSTQDTTHLSVVMCVCAVEFHISLPASYQKRHLRHEMDALTTKANKDTHKFKCYCLERNGSWVS